MKNKSKEVKTKAETTVTGKPVQPGTTRARKINPPATGTGHAITRLYVDCLPEISRHLYAGDGLLHIDETTPVDELMALNAELYSAGPDAVLPSLKKKIEALLGEGNFHFEGWVIGPYSLSFYWLAKTEAYNKAIQPLNWWLKDNEVDNLVAFYAQPLEDDEYKFIMGA